MFKRILVPIDTAEPALAEPGVFFAAELAALADGAVRLVYVFPEFPSVFQEFLTPNVLADQENAAELLLQAIVKKANIPDGRASHTLRTGAPYAEVLAEADDWVADLIIVGSHNPSMSTYLLGSNAQKIVRHANCSVLVVRSHMDEQGAYRFAPAFSS